MSRKELVVLVTIQQFSLMRTYVKLLNYCLIKNILIFTQLMRLLQVQEMCIFGSFYSFEVYMWLL